jgi:hypothetical protein
MTRLLTIIALLAVAVPAAAYDLNNVRPEKTDVYPDYVNPDVRQGGDTIGDATVIPGLPYEDFGTTAGYTDDYDEACPYTISTSPDVVYVFMPGEDVELDIDLCGSSYDTKLYVYDEGLGLVACNDDFYFEDPCGIYVSFLDAVPMTAGMNYYIIVDGYGGDFGDYVLSVDLSEICALECAPGSWPEGEPPLVNDEINAFNDGCGSDNPDGFQELPSDPNGELMLCGGSGWFTYLGSDYRDTDWFVATFGPNGVIELTADAEQPLNVFELGPQDCDNVGVLQQITVGPCSPGVMTVFGEPMTTVWLWAGPSTFVPPIGEITPYEFTYTIGLSGLNPGIVAVETEGLAPEAFVLDHCFPNPFNPLTTIRYGLPEPSPVNLSVYDVAGRLVRTIIAGDQKAAGWHEATWNGMDDSGRRAGAGIYFYRLDAGDYSQTRRMTLVK